MVRLSSSNKANSTASAASISASGNATPKKADSGKDDEVAVAASTTTSPSVGIENVPPAYSPVAGASPGSDSSSSTTPDLAADIATKTGWAAHPNQICNMTRAKKFRLLLARFLDLERPLVTTRMLAFLRQEGCLPELMRFIVNPNLVRPKAQQILQAIADGRAALLSCCAIGLGMFNADRLPMVVVVVVVVLCWCLGCRCRCRCWAAATAGAGAAHPAPLRWQNASCWVAGGL